MADRSTEPWYATEACLYVLHLDGPALAWEYLRRHPDYRHDWLRRCRQPDAARHCGLRLLEDPAHAGGVHGGGSGVQEGNPAEVTRSEQISIEPIWSTPSATMIICSK